jgi:hypothetical protein
MYGSMELKGALTGARYLASLKDQLAERYAAILDALYERLESQRTAGLRAVAALPPDAPVAEKLERALAVVVHLTVPPAMDEEIYEREQERIIRGASWNYVGPFEGEATTFFVAGRFEDTICRERGELKLTAQKCILDSSTVPNSLPFPL